MELEQIVASDVLPSVTTGVKCDVCRDAGTMMSRYCHVLKGFLIIPTNVSQVNICDVVSEHQLLWRQNLHHHRHRVCMTRINVAKNSPIVLMIVKN